jgi:hypothetical protein
MVLMQTDNSKYKLLYVIQLIIRLIIWIYYLIFYTNEIKNYKIIQTFLPWSCKKCKKNVPVSRPLRPPCHRPPLAHFLHGHSKCAFYYLSRLPIVGRASWCGLKMSGQGTILSDRPRWLLISL